MTNSEFDAFAAASKPEEVRALFMQNKLSRIQTDYQDGIRN